MGLYRGLAVAADPGGGGRQSGAAGGHRVALLSGGAVQHLLCAIGFMACAGRQIGGSGSTFRWKPADRITERRGEAAGACIVAPTLGRYDSLPRSTPSPGEPLIDPLRLAMLSLWR